MTDAQAKRFTHDGPLLRMVPARADDFQLVDWSFDRAQVADIVISLTPAPADAVKEVRMRMLKPRMIAAIQRAADMIQEANDRLLIEVVRA